MTSTTRDDKSRVFISWEPSNSRSAALARQFGAECISIHYLALKRPLVAPFKYLLQAAKTWRVLRTRRPGLVFVQNPPVFAPLAVWLYAKFAKADFVIDSHTGVFLESKWKWLSFLHGFLVRRARVSIVTNDFLGQMVEKWGGRYFVFPDVPVEMGDASQVERPEHFVTVVNSFSYDEPLAEVLQAADRLREVQFAITGDMSRCPAEILGSVPDNVRFTGFMTRADYVATLNSSDAAVVLTTENHTMQRGAYEAMALGIPIVTSDWPLLRETFFQGACFTDNTVDSIVNAVRQVIENKDEFAREVVALKAARAKIWEQKLVQFRQLYVPDISEHAVRDDDRFSH